MAASLCIYFLGFPVAGQTLGTHRQARPGVPDMEAHGALCGGWVQDLAMFRRLSNRGTTRLYHASAENLSM